MDSIFFKQRARLDTRKFFFSQRVVNECNNLSSEIVSANTVNTFKNRLDPMLKRREGGTFKGRDGFLPLY